VFFKNPLFGKGLGFTQEWHAPQRPHDMYLYLAAEGGVIGLGLFVSMLAVMWQLTRGQDRLIVGLFAILSLFSHNAFEKPELFLILALAVSSSFLSRRMEAQSAAPRARRTPATDEQAQPWASATPVKETQ
jgi:O-antigen ligase